MMRRRLRSLQLRLAVRLAIVYIVATTIAVGILAYQAYDTVGSLNDRELMLRANDLAQYVSIDDTGVPQLRLPPRLAAAYKASGNADVFAIRAGDGHVFAASPPSFGERVASWPAAEDEPSFFRVDDLGRGAPDYYGLSIAADSAAGPLSISVARAAGADLMIHSVLREFAFDIGWTIPILIAITLIIGVLAIRSGLKPIGDASKLASSIGPNTTSVRLPEQGVPQEILPLVTSMNRALDRLERGFAVQRQFTANAAHELRTPLAIVTAALDTMEGNGAVMKLKSDVARMNRLVEQLLRVARLDAVALDTSGTADLVEVATSVVTTMAPWAVAQGKSIALAGTAGAVTVRGNTHAIADALRNLVENAIAHTPSDTEVTVTVQHDGSVSVADHGPGVPEEDQPHVFKRFWRGKGAETPGAGLGLAIVDEIMKAHQGTVRIGDNLGGGAVFTLSFVGP